MKICMYSIDRVFDRGSGGVRRFLELMDALRARGHEVHLYSADTLQSIRENGLKGASILPEGAERSWKMAGLKSALGNRALFKAIRAERYDRIVVFDVRAAFSLAANGVGPADLFLRQDMLLYKRIQLEDAHAGGIKTFAVLAAAQLTEALCLAKARRVVVQCRFDLRGILKRHPLLRKRIEKKAAVQINNINPSWIVGSARAHAGDPQNAGRYDLAFVGNFKDKRKGHDVLLAALRRLKDEGMTVETAIIGDGKHLEACQKAYADMENIHFLGRLSDPIPVVAASRLMIVPSYADSCPNTVMEALYDCVPVIGANRSGIPEILNDPSWCFEMDEASVAQALRHALEPQMNSEIRKAQRARRDELLFDWGKKMAEIVESDVQAAKGKT